ncbi:MAG TPA: S53 family peptidase [Mycobacteriales bacterium]|nr:S53 family peptidase [Mycobacteriales bacterium]
MHRRKLLLIPFLAVAGLLSAAVAGASPAPHESRTVAAKATTKDHSVCKHAHRARSRCFAIRVDHLHRGRVRHESSPIGYGPSDLQAAYSLPSASAGSGQTVAVVDAYDDPDAARDLATYRAQYGLPACATSNGCFRKVDQTGGHDYPDPDGGWGQEISLDLDMVSAVCPHCHVLLVEADSASMANLGAAVDTAVRLGASAVSNSYGGPDASDRSYGRYYHHPGVAVVASAGDSGYGVAYPASSKWVTAVGGTTLRRSSAARGFSESAWSNSGSGCSTLNIASWQPAATTGCSGRAEADVSAVADPATGVAVYDSYAFDNTSGWLTFGGTSASSPIIAGVYALAGNETQTGDGASYLWSHHSGLHDVTGGSNGTCSTEQWCTARRGWDGPTGWGTPDGTSGF